MEEHLFKAYKKMFLIRVAEQRIADHYLKNKIMSFVHFYIGQEAVAVGVADTLRKGDKMLGNHRSHGHYLAKGGNLRAMLCELLGKKEGSSHGKGGSMHMIDKSVNFVGSTPILGGVVPLSCGVAFEQKFYKRKNITVAFLGDGAFEEGVIPETINLAGLFQLPLLLVVENNLYSVNSPLSDRRAARHSVKKLVEGLGATYARADGNNYRDVEKKASFLARHLRSGKGPAVLECITYRHMAHSAPIFDESCRVEDVAERRKAKDSVARLRREVLKMGVSEKALLSAERKVEAKVDTDLTYAISAPFPRKETLHTDLYV